MYVDLRSPVATLVEPDDFSRLSVQVRSDSVAPAGDQDFGYFLDSDTAMVSVEWIGRMGPSSDPDWRAGLRKMLAYAGRNGWLHGEFVQAHVTRSEALD
jgi:hypothetical protein